MLIVIFTIFVMYVNYTSAYASNCGMSSKCRDNYAKKTKFYVKQCIWGVNRVPLKALIVYLPITKIMKQRKVFGIMRSQTVV